MLFLSAEALVAESLPGSPPLNNSLGVLVACHNFGTASVTQSFNHEFTWHNDATTPLVVEGVSTSCDCLQVTAFPRVIPAGGTDKLTVAAHPKTPGPTDWVVFARVTGSAEARLFWLSGTIGDAARTAFPPDLLVAATNLLANPARLAEISFVDVRGQDQYRLGRIPGSLNLPLFTVKARGFLRPKRLVLLNEGHNPADLLQEASRLKQLQFASVAVLDGGLRAWQQAGGQLEGEDVAASRLATITPAQFHFGQADNPWLVEALGDSAAATGDWLGLTATPLPAGGPALLPGLTTALQRNPAARRLLLVSAHGDDYAAQEKILHGFTGPPVFYLAGGAKGYAQFLRQQLAQQNRRTLTATSGSGPKFVGAARPAGGGGSCCGGRK